MDINPKPGFVETYERAPVALEPGYFDARDNTYAAGNAGSQQFDALTASGAYPPPPAEQA
ncbi:MAG: hypothetical protein IPO08_23680 [Xanthomonadales bacterium]|nr:hypothetical protein [Xanthomonadales bacterium]